MLIENNVDISKYSGLKIRARAHLFAKINQIDDIKYLSTYAQLNKVPLTPIGSGTNTLWGGPFINRLISIIQIQGFEIVKENNHHAYVQIGAGENWDKTVKKLVELDLSGIEALSGIPGTIGAAPIQNIGAYGSEICQTLESLTVYDLIENKVIELDKTDCKFGYRNSIFKNSAKDKFIITSIILKLSKDSPKIPQYKDVLEYFKQHKISPSLKAIREAVIDIRGRKLPDPKMIPNCGSFFKNPEIDCALALELKGQFPTMPQYPTESGVKISAGWLIEQCGFKGQSFGCVSVYEKNALVLISKIGTTTDDVALATKEISKGVEAKFSITLEREPVLIS